MATIKKDIGAYSAYAIAVKHGYKGTEAEWVAAQEQARVDSEAAAKAAKTAQEAAEAAREQAQTAKTSAETAQGAAAQAAQTATGAAGAATQAAQAAQTAKEAAEQAQTGAQEARTGAETAQTKAQAAKTAAEEAAQEAKAAQTGAVEAKTGAVEAQGKAEEAAQGVAADREQIGANKSGLEAAQQELTAAKEQLSETKAALATAQEDLKKAQRAIKFQAALNRGQTWDFETDDQEAYQRTVPSGAKAGAVMEYGGKTVGWNQLIDNVLIRASVPANAGIAFTKLSAQSFRLSGTASDSGSHVADFYFSNDNSLLCVSGHKYLAIGGSAACSISIYGDIVHPIQNAANSFIETATKNGSSVKFWARLPITDGQAYDLVVKIAFIDLTLLYGTGNEPTDTTDPRIAKIEAYAAAHPEYNSGELVSGLVDSVVEQGANLISIQALQAWWPNDTEVVGDILYIKSNSGPNGIVRKKFPISIPAGAVISAQGVKPQSNMAMSKKARISFAYANGQILNCFLSDEYCTPKKIENKVASNDIIAAYFDYTEPNGFFGIANLMIRLPYASPDYSPYHQTTHPIPSAVRNLPGYGWSAGSVSNTIECTENSWQYVQRVGSVDLGKLTWWVSNKGTYQSFGSAVSGWEKTEGAVISPKFRENLAIVANGAAVGIWLGVADRIYVCDGTSTTVEAISAAMQGETLYYELSTPITTDITALMGDSLAPFAVEAGGSITLHHPKADEGFAIDVPAKIQYITKLSEVSSNG